MNKSLSYIEISNMAAEHGFSAAYCTPSVKEDGAPAEIQTLVLLVRSYVPGGKLVDAFYPASNAAYHAAGSMAGKLEERYGIAAQRLSQVRLKPVCARLPAFGRGVNTLNYLPRIGSRFCMELLGLPVRTEEKEETPFPWEELPCARCGRCIQACPMGAITEEGFERERCIRYHMLNGRSMPAACRCHFGSTPGVHGMLGCEVCQMVCPANAIGEAARQEREDPLPLEALLACDRDTLQRFGALYGANYANKNRIRAQAALCAAGSHREELLPLIEALKGSPSPAVAEHAAWAEEKMITK